MTVDGMIINASTFEVVRELKKQLAEQKIYRFEKIFDSGDDIMVCCPYHKAGQERRPSSGFRKEDGMFHCFACGETHSFTEVINHCFGQSTNSYFGRKWLIDNFVITKVEERKLDLNLSREPQPSEYYQTLVPEEELDSYRYYHPYMRKRGLTDDIIERFDIGYDKRTDSITFPVRDVAGGCKFVAKRSVKFKRFDLPKGVDKPLYGEYELYRVLLNSEFDRFNEIYVCEGLFDCLRLWCNGKYAVAGFGCLFSDNQIQLLETLPTRKLIFALDNDIAGQTATEKLKRTVCGKMFSTAILPDGRKDIGECTDEEIQNLRETLY